MKDNVFFYIIMTFLGVLTSVLNKFGPFAGNLGLVGLALFTIVWAALAWQNRKKVGKISILVVFYVIILALSL